MFKLRAIKIRDGVKGWNRKQGEDEWGYLPMPNLVAPLVEITYTRLLAKIL